MTTRTDRITSTFDWASTATDVIAGIDLAGKRALITRAAGGIGLETARAIALAGAEVTIAARNLGAAEQAAADIRRTVSAPVRTAYLDLADAATVDELAAAVNAAGPLHLLINNAGVMALPERRLSPEGHELQFATNHLGHFRLAVGLLPALRAEGARVVAVSSRASLNSPVVFDDIDFERRSYDPALAYAQSKTANVLFAVGAATRWAGDGVFVNALHPGAVLDSNLSRYYDPAELEAIRNSGKYTYKSTAQGAATSTFVATSPLLDGIAGRYFENCQEADVDDPTACGIDAAGVAPHALDPEAADRLWAVSEQMTGLTA
ncbi:SDR family NAD(P)-dependent oxidoreductase [Gryllotalpicola reticulitermitis]|uniref:SDR family NAD(P)-dependent oxidoreductase n=1 Tax=Gryllotalpicola reticulitermitis TaxID=1184153 RepID=A0ABV8Q295_9MICO